MKKLWKFLEIVVLLGIIGASGYFAYQKSLSPCQKTLEYSIGRFDSQFGISQEDFKNYLAKADVVWEKQIGKNVFEYNPNASFKINLIYDERQLAIVQKQKEEFGLTASENVFKQLDIQFINFKNDYDAMTVDYEKSLVLYKAHKLSNVQINNLNNEGVNLNNMIVELNKLLKERNDKAAEYNKIAADYNNKYNGGLEFNQAEYKGNPSNQTGEINVYEFNNERDLVLALAHEFGHALGLEHVENPSSVMYYLTNTNTQDIPTLTTEDLAELNRVCPDAR
jgi:hypothetical protein